MPLIDPLTYALTLPALVKYLLIFIATPIGGPVLILGAGFLLYTGDLEFIPLLFTFALAELATDCLWYYLGYKYADASIHRFGKFFSVTPELFASVKEQLSERQIPVLFTAKVAMNFGLAIPIFITAGAAKVPFLRYLAVNAAGEIILVAALLSAGFFLSEISSYLADAFRIAFLIFAAFIVGALAYGFSRYTTRKVLD